MTNTISASEANQGFSAMLRQVQQGEDFVVTSRGRAVARVIPFEENSEPSNFLHLLEKLEKLPHRVLKDWSRDDLYS